MIFLNDSPYHEINSVIKDVENYENINTPEFYKEIVEHILSKFKNSELEIIKSYHTKISSASGMHVGLASKNITSFLQVVGDFFNDLKVKYLLFNLYNRRKLN